MPCRVTRNNKGQIIKVLDSQGRESKVFNRITQLPHVESLEQAVDIYDEILKANPYQDESKEFFFSNALSAVTNLKDKNPKNIKGWVNQLTDVQKNGGVRNVGQELQWIGFQDFLNDWVEENSPKNGNIPFEVVEDYINNNKIEIEEIVKFGESGNYASAESERVRIQDAYGLDITIDEDAFGNPVVDSVHYNGVSIGDADSIYDDSVPEDFPIAEVEDALSQLQKMYEGVDVDDGTKYEIYTLSGGENYREVLLTMPYVNKEVLSLHDQYEAVKKERDGLPFNSEERKEKSDQLEQISNQMSLYKDYKSGHFSEHNILAHVRLKEREVPSDNVESVSLFATEESGFTIRGSRNLSIFDGDLNIEKEVNIVAKKFGLSVNDIEVKKKTTPERVLFIEEVQSDWAQQGKKYGFNNPLQKEPLVNIDRISETELQYIAFFSNGQQKAVGKGVFPDHKATEQEVRDYFAEILSGMNIEINRLNSEKVPLMPYQKTDQWIGMAMRRVYQMAVEEGFDKVAWVTGEQSADRYDLSKQIRTVKHSKNGDGTYNISAEELHNGNLVIDRLDVPESELENIFGKDIAQKIINREGDVPYDKNYVRKELRKHGRRTEVFEKDRGFYVRYEDGYEMGVWPSRESAQKELERFNADYIDNPIENEQRELSGLDLKVGGEGMKAFYNSILPKVAKKEAQRFDKQAKVEVIQINTLLSNGPYIRQNSSGGFEVVDNNSVANVFKTIKEASDYIEKNSKSKQLSVPITNKMKERLVGGIPLFSLESGDNKYDTFKEALDQTDSKTIDVVSNGKVIATFPSSLDERTVEGVVNSFITDGILSPNKVVLDGKTYFMLTGETAKDRMIAEEFFKETIRTSLPADQYSVKDGLIEFFPKKEGVSEEGSEHKVISDRILKYFSADTVVSKKENIDEKNLKLNLLKVLQDMGISVMSLQQYQQKFKNKSQNIPPSAEALADIANRVIAFKDGKATLDNLTEEVMHLIVETLPQEQIAELSDLIRNSEEYQQYYEQYKDVYNNNEALIEKEILGKILKNIAINKTGNKSKSFLSRLFSIIRDFFNGLTLSQTHKDQLKQLNGLVERYIIQENGESFSDQDLRNSQEIALMYSLSEQVSNAQGAFETTFKNLTDFRQFNSYKRELKNISFDNLKGRELAVAVSRFIEMSTKLIETTDSAIKTAKSKGKALSGQNKAILEDLDNEISSNLDSLAVELSTPQPGIDGTERIKLADKLQENSARISELRALNDQTTDDHIKQMVEEVVQQMGEAESEFYREQVEKVLRGQVDDTNKIFSFFGQLHHASNPILNMIGSKIWEMNMKANQGTKEDISPFLNYMEENNISKKDFESLFKDGYLQDAVDHRAFDDALLTREMEAFSEISGQTFDNLAEYKKAKSKDELKELGEEEYGKYRTLLQEKQLPLIETVMNQQYYKDLFDKYERLNISGATQSFLKQNSAQRGAIKAGATQSYIGENGENKTRVVLTPEDNDNLNSISKIRKARKNIYSETSTLKKGLKLSNTKPEGESVLLPTGLYLYLDISDDMSQGEKDFANISFDLHKLDNEYMETVKAEGSQPNVTTGLAKLNFISYINSIQDTHSEKELFNVIMSNLDVALSQEFYDSLNGDSFLKGDTLDKLNSDNLKLVKDVKDLYAKRNAILSMYRNTSSPFEIDRMTESDQDIVRSLSVRISDALKILNLPEQVKEEGETVGEKAPNKAYLQELKRRGITENTQEELDFLVNSQHTNVSQINKLKDAYYKNQAGIPLSDSDARILGRYLGDNLVETQLNYAKNNLQPYYTRFAPIGYKSIEERLEQGEDITEILDSIFNDSYLNVRIDNSFEEKDNPLKNPNYDDTYDGGFRQPKKGTFVNKSFIDRFGVNEKGEATKNKELFEARRLYLDARKKGLEKMREPGYNPYKEIQISKTTTEKLRTLAKGQNKRATAKELIKDTFAYRIDDLAYGEQGFSTNRTLPKYYTRDLEDPTDVSSDYVFALSQFVSRANEYAAKRNVISDIDALYDILLRSKRHSKSKDLNNTIAMADSYIDNSIYGKIENRTYEIKVPGTDYSMDLAKVSRVFTKYVSLKNLGFNTSVPLTGLFSGLVSKRVEEWIGEKLNRESARLATAEYRKLFRDGRSQALDFNDNSKLFLIGQAFGIYDISDKARNAKYDKFQRTFSKSAMGLHTMANYPIIPKIALTVMYDNRVIGGKIMNRQQFFQQGTRDSVPKEQLEAEWKAAEENAIYNYMNFDKTGFTWSNRIKDKISDEDYLENRKLFMMKFIRSQISNVDATIPPEMRLAAQRDAVGSMMLLHKGFLSIFLQNRLKRRGLNIDTGLVEEGSYRTLSRLMADFFNTKGGMSAKIDKLKQSIQPPDPGASNEEWLEYELNIRNMRRIGKELAAMGILVTLGALIFAAATDPDNEDIYALQMSSYLTTRLLNESGTAFTPSILTDLSDVIESPIVTYDTAKEFTQFYKLFDGDEISRGKYRGLSVRERWITKNVLGFKGVYDIFSARNIRETEKTYRLYNEENINRATLGLNSLFKSIYKD